METLILNTDSINKLKNPAEKHQFKILIVDDDITIAKTLGEILQERGHIVTVTDEGISCINKCQNGYFDIIFMDYHLNDINGTDTADLIKSNFKTKSIIFAFTGDDSVTALKQFKKIGMDGALIKPIDIELINKLMTSLELRNNLDKRIIKNIRDSRMKRQLFVFN